MSELDPRTPVQQQADHIFFTEIWEMPTIKKIRQECEDNHPKLEGEEEFPDEYWDMLSERLRMIFTRCLERATPEPKLQVPED